MKYNVGDYVRIRNNIKRNEMISGHRISKKMAEYAGKITKVACNSYFFGGYSLENDPSWVWGEDALEPIKSKDILSIASEIAETNITLKNQSCGSTPHV